MSPWATGSGNSAVSPRPIAPVSGNIRSIPCGATRRRPTFATNLSLFMPELHSPRRAQRARRRHPPGAPAARGPTGEKRHVASHQRRGSELHRQHHAGADRFPHVDWRQLGHPVLASQGLHPGLHDRARLHGPAEARIRQAQHEDHRPQRRSGRRITRSGRRTSRKRRVAPSPTR